MFTWNFRFTSKDPQQRLLYNLLQKNIYNKNLRPENVTDRVALVKTNMYIRMIEHIDSDDQQWKVQITLRHLWNDQRLKFDNQDGKVKYVKLEDPNLIWRPDTFIVNSKKTLLHSDLLPNVMVRIYPNGNVQFSARITSIISCRMDLKRYPFDTQICSIKLASCKFTISLNR